MSSSESLKKRIRKIGATADKLMDQAADRIEELEREQRYFKMQLTVGRGELVYALLSASKKAFARELEAVDTYVLFDKVLSCIGPRCLLWMDFKAADVAELGRYIDSDHSEEIAGDVEKLERLKAMIEETIKRVHRTKPRARPAVAPTLPGSTSSNDDDELSLPARVSAESAESRVARGLHPDPGPHCVGCGRPLTPAEARTQLPDHDEICDACMNT